MACSGAWSCYDGWGKARRTSFVEITHAYAATDECPGGAAATVTGAHAAHAFDAVICYSPDYYDGLDVAIPFDEDATYGDEAAPVLSVTITSPSSAMVVSLDMEPSQRKTVFVGQELRAKHARGTTASFLRQAAIKDDDAEVVASSARPYQSDLLRGPRRPRRRSWSG